MGRRKEVVAKRGCTCCGTGCAVPILVVPTVALALSGMLGALVAVAVSLPVTLGVLHGLAWVSRRGTDDQMAE